jgi:hypothetical protein
MHLKFLFLIINCFCISAVFAQPKQSLISDVVPKPFRLVYDETDPGAQVEFILSSIRKINGRWRYEKSEYVNGGQITQTYEFEMVERAYVRDRVAGFALQQGWQLLFECQGLACGRSYGWSELLENKMLHGLDDTQSYWVWRSGANWYSAFVIERGNRRVYLRWLEIISNGETPQAVNLESQWQSDGYAVLASNFLTDSDSLLKSNELLALTGWLESLPITSIAVVGHNSVADSSLEKQQSDALKAAELVRQILAVKVPDKSYKVYGLGPIAPRGGETIRVEIVPLP